MPNQQLRTFSAALAHQLFAKPQATASEEQDHVGDAS